MHIWHQDWDGHALGYKTAADILVQHVIDKERDQDILVYPIGFLYRQYLELRLKELISVGSQLLDRRVSVPTHHNIVRIWMEARRIIEEVYPHPSSNTHLDQIEDRIKELDHLDPRSYAFRYPTDKAGSATLRGVQHINLEQLRAVVQGISVVLEDCSMGIWENLRAKHDMMSEYADHASEMRYEMMAEHQAAGGVSGAYGSTPLQDWRVRKAPHEACGKQGMGVSRNAPTETWAPGHVEARHAVPLRER